MYNVGACIAKIRTCIVMVYEIARRAPAYMFLYMIQGFFRKQGVLPLTKMRTSLKPFPTSIRHYRLE